MTGITVREVAREDHAAWAQLWAGYNAFYGRSGATALPASVVATTWQRFFDPAEPVHALVAEAGGRVVGLAHYLFHRSTIQVEPTCYLQDLFTAEQARGMGAGRKLIEAVYERAGLAGLRGCTGRPTRPTATRCSCTTAWPSAPVSWSIASCFDLIRQMTAIRKLVSTSSLTLAAIAVAVAALAVLVMFPANLRVW